MPSTSLRREDGREADIVLGDRYGTSCATRAHRPRRGRRCASRGYSVVRNKPYAGGFITEHYGEPALGRHALQIEINRALYMDERTPRADGRDFDAARRAICADAFAAVMRRRESHRARAAAGSAHSRAE